MVRTPLVYDSGNDGRRGASGGRSVPAWWHGPEPDSTALRELYVAAAHTEVEAAVLLAVSRPRVAAAMQAAGIQRRTTRKACPLTAAALRRDVQAGATAQELAHRYGVSRATASRWLADAGLAPPDPDIDPVRLRQLYVDRQLTTREVSAELAMPRARILRALAAAGIPARDRTQRRPRGNRAAVTDTALREVYLQPGMTIAKACTHFGVSPEFLRRRLRETELVKRPGTFTPHLDEPTAAAVRRHAAELYSTGLSMKGVAAQLGVNTSTVRAALHEARVPVRRSGPRGAESDGRSLVDDLYADPTILAVLHRHGVHIPDPDRWQPAGPCESYAPLPLPAGLVHELYLDIGLGAYQIALLCGVGIGTVRTRLRTLDIEPRVGQPMCPWNQRRLESTR